MATKNNKKCILCGKVYSFCNRCEEFDHLPRWMAIYCGDNCKTIFMTLTDYSSGNLTKAEAAATLRKCDLSKKNDFHAFNRSLVNEILDIKEDEKKEEKQVVKTDILAKSVVKPNTTVMPKQVKDNK